MTIKLLPIQVEHEALTVPTSDIITHDVISAFSSCAGDFADALPYCLLEARRSFHKDALADPADYDENIGRKLACEVLARKIVNAAPITRQYLLLCTRYTRIDSDGHTTVAISALELACDQNATFFLSSAEAQQVTTALWRGHIIQSFDDEGGHITYKIYAQAGKRGFGRHFDPARLAVPKYTNIFRMLLWILFVAAYTWALQTPDREPGVEDVVLYVQWAGYICEDITKLYKVGSLDAIGFWEIVNLAIFTILGVALAFRAADNSTPTDNITYRQRSFQILSCAAPLIWAKLLTIFDLLTFFSVLQVVVAKMMRESAVFFALLGFISIGFAQSLTGLDVADKSDETAISVVRTLIEAVLGNPAFDRYASGIDGYGAYGLILYYLFSFLALVILLNVLVALFSSAYAQVTDDSIAQSMAFFSRKVVASIRAPDEFAFPAPFNLIELAILPLEFVLPAERYASLSRGVMRVLFFVPLCAIAAYESIWDAAGIRKEEEMLSKREQEYDENPEADESDKGTLSKVSFDDLVQRFPDITLSTVNVTLKEVRGLRKEVETLRELLVKRES